LGLVIGAVAWPATAQADDASVWAAVTGHRAEVNAADKAYTRAYNAWRRGGRPTRGELEAMISADEQINAVVAQIRADTVAQEPSTATGAKAKRLSIKGLDLLVVANNSEIRSMREALAGRRRAARRWYRRSAREIRTARRTLNRAARAWAHAGFRP
jgi:hypothetical protein